MGHVITTDSKASGLYSEVSGPLEGRPVVLLHGWGSSAQLMRPAASMLNDQFRVHNLDLPGHGQSPPPPQPYDVEAFARVVQTYMEENEITSAAIIGHSNGGRIGLYMAADPDLSKYVECLVLISPSGIRRRRTAKYYVKKATATALKAPFRVLPEPLRSRGLEWLRYTLVWKLLGSSDYRQLEGVMRETFVLTVNSYLDDLVRNVKVPTLIFRGDQDSDITSSQVETICDAIPGAAVIELKGAGHYGYLDQPNVFREATRHFLHHS